MIPAALRREILNDNPDGGLRSILMQHEGNAADAGTWDRNVLFDVDTPSDYDELKARWGKYDLPTHRGVCRSC